MQFNSLRNANVANYIAAGKASGRSSQGTFDSIKKAAPNYAAITQVIQDAKSAKSQAAQKATAEGISGAISANKIKTIKGLEADFGLARTKSKEKRRFAGYLGALGGSLMNDISEAMRPAKKPPEIAKPYMPDEGIFDDRLSDALRRLEEIRNNPTAEPTKPTLPDISGGVPGTPGAPGGPVGVPPAPNGLESTQTNGAPQVSTPTQQVSYQGGSNTWRGQGIPTSAELAQPMSTDQVYTVFKNAGASDKQARIFAQGIVPKESANIPNNNTITSGLIDDAGETSFGLAQINMFGQNPQENARRKALFGITDETELHDPAVNARAALTLLNEQGWGAWSTYDPSMQAL